MSLSDSELISDESDSCSHCGMYNILIDGFTCENCIGWKRYCKSCCEIGFVYDDETDSDEWCCDDCLEKEKNMIICSHCNNSDKSIEEWLELGFPECDNCEQTRLNYQRCFVCGEFSKYNVCNNCA